MTVATMESPSPQPRGSLSVNEEPFRTTWICWGGPISRSIRHVPASPKSRRVGAAAEAEAALGDEPGAGEPDGPATGFAGSLVGCSSCLADVVDTRSAIERQNFAAPAKTVIATTAVRMT